MSLNDIPNAEFEKKATMHKKRFGHSALYFECEGENPDQGKEDFVIVSGSRKRPSDDDNSTSVEVYDAYKDTWYKCKKLKTGRHHHLTLTYKTVDKTYMYVIGGVNTSSFGVKNVERLDFGSLYIEYYMRG